MSLLEFEFEDLREGWSLSNTAFDRVNLLVGFSGVGKTRCLGAIERARKCATQGAFAAPGCRWYLSLAVDGHVYDWRAETSLPEQKPLASDELAEAGDDSQEISPLVHGRSNSYFLKEELRLRDGEVVLSRKGNEIEFKGSPLPMLKPSESLINLLKREPSIQPFSRALRRFLFSSADMPAQNFVLHRKDEISSIESKVSTVEDLRDSASNILMKGYVLGRKFPERFSAIVQQYCEIFPTVVGVRIGLVSELDPEHHYVQNAPFELIAIALMEHGMDRWILQPNVSSGMLRTLYHLLELELSPPGTVILIDEFENSLGVNCLPQVEEHILSRPDLQFVLTSHHPYIINNIPKEYWRIVTRKGPVITIHHSKDIPALNTRSHLDQFTLLTNLKEYEEGLQ